MSVNMNTHYLVKESDSYLKHSSIIIQIIRLDHYCQYSIKKNNNKKSGQLSQCILETIV